MAQRVVFRSVHALPHIVGIGLSTELIEAEIQEQIVEDCAQESVTGYFWGRLRVLGVVVEYRVYTLLDSSLNVGTYYRAKPD